LECDDPKTRERAEELLNEIRKVRFLRRVRLLRMLAQIAANSLATLQHSFETAQGLCDAKASTAGDGGDPGFVTFADDAFLSHHRQFGTQLP